MKFKIDKYLLKKTEELAFITVKKEGDFHLDGYEIPKEGLNVPIKNEVLVKGIKENTAQDGINSMSIADAMIYIIGIDPQFRYNDDLKNREPKVQKAKRKKDTNKNNGISQDDRKNENNENNENNEDDM